MEIRVFAPASVANIGVGYDILGFALESPGDEVVTHTGNIKKVLQLHKNPLNNRVIYDIKLAGTPTVSVTENHRLLSISDEQEKWGKSPGWNSVEYLRIGDWIAIPKKEGGSTYVFDVKDLLDTFTSDGNNVFAIRKSDEWLICEASSMFTRLITPLNCNFNVGIITVKL